VPVISASRLLAEGRVTGPGSVVVDAGGRISDVIDGASGTPDGAVSIDGGLLTPGLIDLQNNGVFGADFASATPEQWGSALAGLAACGVTSVAPTVISAPLPDLAAAVARCAVARDAHRDTPVSRVVGVHLEGPFLSRVRRGTHRADWIMPPTNEALDELFGYPGLVESLAVVTLAPELEGAKEAIRRFTEAGVVVSVGHSDALAAEVWAAADSGATMATHIFNAQRPMTHREPGVPGAVLTDPRFYVGLIVDGQHVHPAICRLAFAAAPGRVVAVTDSILTAGMPQGTWLDFGGGPVANDETGLGRREDGTISGAGITLDEGVRRMAAAGIELAEVLAAATVVPADLIGRADLGRLAVGACADLVWWDDDLVPRRVWVGGREVPT
jgi:N-acetylglucosamine-6-phosphate deacetylase